MSRPSPREAPVSSTMRFFRENRSGMVFPSCHTECGGNQANGMVRAAEPQPGAAKVRHLGRRRIAEILSLGKRLRLARGPVGFEFGQGSGQGARTGQEKAG